MEKPEKEARLLNERELLNVHGGRTEPEDASGGGQGGQREIQIQVICDICGWHSKWNDPIKIDAIKETHTNETGGSETGHKQFTVIERG